jgi:signal transduction histidine kinase
MGLAELVAQKRSAIAAAEYIHRREVDLSKREATHAGFLAHEVLIGVLIEAIAAELQPQADARQIRLECDVPKRLTVQADPRLTRSALTNLIQNAIKLSHPGGNVVVRSAQSAAERHVEIADSCGGLPDDGLARIFAPFEQAGSDRSGFGLGLAIARDAAESHGGHLGVRNIPGKGCVFVFMLPIGT